MTKKSKGLTKDFVHFVEFHTDLDQEEQGYVLHLFDQKRIKKAVRISLILLMWTFFASFFDSALASSAIVASMISGISLFYFIPNIIFALANFIAKIIFLSWYDSNRDFTSKQIVYAALPFAGVIFFLGSVFRREKLFFRTIRGYLRYVRKRGVKSILSLIGIKNSS